MTYSLGLNPPDVYPPLPPIPVQFGYSVLSWFAVAVVRHWLHPVHPAVGPRVWFTLAFNPRDNVESSNPMFIYTKLSRAVKGVGVTGPDFNSAEINNLKSSLINFVIRRATTEDERKAWESYIRRAPAEYFRPEVWRLNLAAIALRRTSGDVHALLAQLRQEAQDAVNLNPPQRLQLDEYLIYDLQWGEFDVIIPA